MMKYFATFPAGVYPIISKHLKGFSVDELRIVESDDSSVTFNSALSVNRLTSIRYFTNIFLVADDQSDLPEAVFNGRYFRLLGINKGKPQAIDAKLRAELLKRIEVTYKLRDDTHKSKNDFCWIERDNGKKFLALRLMQSSFKNHSQSAGELSPQVANVLCLAAGVNSKSKVLDMFAGYGAIPYEAVRGFGCKEVTAVDIDVMPKRHEMPVIKWHKADATKLDFIEEGSIDKIVADPAWGVYDAKSYDLPTLYSGFLKEVERVLKPAGVAVILSGYEKAKEYLKDCNELELISELNILVSGKKAVIYKLRRNQKQRV